MPKLSLTDVKQEELEKIRLLKAEGVLSEDNIKDIEVIIEAAQKIQEEEKKVKTISYAKGAKSFKTFLESQYGVSQNIVQVIERVGLNPTSNDAMLGKFQNIELRLQKITSIAKKVLGLTIDTERRIAEGKQEIKRSFAPRKGRSIFNKVLGLEELERKQIQANAQTLIVINHYFSAAWWTFREFVKGRIIVREEIGSLLRNFNGVLTEEKFKTAKNYALQPKNSTIGRVIKILNQIKNLMEHFEKYVKREEKEEIIVLRYENRITKEYEKPIVPYIVP